MYDVVIVGGGPAGATAAKRLAEAGLRTLVLEKRGLPRDKVCSGWILEARARVGTEFGEIPDTVLCPEREVRGIVLRVPSGEKELLSYPMQTAWRRDFDRWMLEKGQEKGAEVWDNARAVAIAERAARYRVSVRRGEETVEVEAAFLIGADGAASLVRRYLYPGLSVTYSQAVQELYDTRVDLPEGYANIFLGSAFAPFYFDVHTKDGLLVMECGCRLGQSKELMGWGRQLLARDYGFDPQVKPVRTGACIEPVLYAELFDGSFRPARGNALLVGDAAGLLMPVTGEGILGGMESGAWAAEAIVEARRQNSPAAEAYLQSLAGFVERVRQAFDLVRRCRQSARQGDATLLGTVAGAWRQTIGGL